MDNQELQYLCRVCLGKGASLPIFEGVSNGAGNAGALDIYSKLCQCVGEKIVDRDGYPRYLCNLCYITLNTATKFIEQYKVSAQLLELQSQSLLNHLEFEALDSYYILQNRSVDEVYSFDTDVKEEANEDLMDILKPFFNNKNITIKNGSIDTIVKEEPNEELMLDIEPIFNKENRKTIKSGTKHKDGARRITHKIKKKRSSALAAENQGETSLDPHTNNKDEKKESEPQRQEGKKLQVSTEQDVTIKRAVKSLQKTIYLCSECDEVFEDSTKLSDHRKKTHSTLQCPHCPKMCHKGNFRDHVRRTHLKAPVACSYCGKMFKRKQTCIRHEQRHEQANTNKQALCSQCEMVFEDSTKLSDHKKKMHTLKCPHCPKLYHKDNIRRHIRKAHLKLQTFKRETAVACFYCGKMFDKKSTCIRHELHVHEGIREQMNNKDQLGSKCIREPIVEADVLCSECGETFKDSSKLTAHRKIKHMSRKLLKCSHCPKMFHHGNLNNHVRRTHLIPPVACSYCGKLFKSKKSCIYHERSVHEGIQEPKMKSDRHSCAICKLKFWCKQSLLCHMRRVHTGERPEICSVCGNSFISKKYLKEHMLLHTGEKPFKCPVCGKGHAGRANMKSHIRHNHRLSDLDEKTREELSKCKINYLKHMKP